jgi:hypothetical protein
MAWRLTHAQVGFHYILASSSFSGFIVKLGDTFGVI